MPKNIVVKFEVGAQWVINSSLCIIQGQVISTKQQIFSGNGTTIVCMNEVWADWWGVVGSSQEESSSIDLTSNVVRLMRSIANVSANTLYSLRGFFIYFSGNISILNNSIGILNVNSNIYNYLAKYVFFNLPGTINFSPGYFNCRENNIIWQFNKRYCGNKTIFQNIVIDFSLDVFSNSTSHEKTMIEDIIFGLNTTINISSSENSNNFFQFYNVHCPGRMTVQGGRNVQLVNCGLENTIVDVSGLVQVKTNFSMSQCFAIGEDSNVTSVLRSSGSNVNLILSNTSIGSVGFDVINGQLQMNNFEVDSLQINSEYAFVNVSNGNVGSCDIRLSRGVFRCTSTNIMETFQGTIEGDPYNNLEIVLSGCSFVGRSTDYAIRLNDANNALSKDRFFCIQDCLFHSGYPGAIHVLGGQVYVLNSIVHAPGALKLTTSEKLISLHVHGLAFEPADFDRQNYQNLSIGAYLTILGSRYENLNLSFRDAYVDSEFGANVLDLSSEYENLTVSGRRIIYSHEIPNDRNPGLVGDVWRLKNPRLYEGKLLYEWVCIRTNIGIDSGDNNFWLPLSYYSQQQ